MTCVFLPLQVTFGEGSTISESTELSFASDVIAEQGVSAELALYLTSTVTVSALTEVFHNRPRFVVTRRTRHQYNRKKVQSAWLHYCNTFLGNRRVFG